MNERPFKPDTTTTRMEGVSMAVLALSFVLTACSTEPRSEVQDSAPPAIESTAVRFIDPPSGPGAMAPNLTAGRDGVLLTWLEPTDNGHAFYLAKLQAQQWKTSRRITESDALFANWADLSMVAQSAGGTLFAHWLQKLGTDTYAYGAELARSRDDGETWEPLGLLHDDASPSEHGFVSYVPLPDGDVQAFWLDGRAMLGGGSMQLRTTRLDDDGPHEEPGASALLDDRVCECCATDAALTEAGPVVVYRNRNESEIRDIAVVRSAGEGWSEPVVIHDDGWQIHGCPVNGPAITADGARVAVAWFTASAAKARVAVAFSSDAGGSFTEPILIDDAKPLGRVDVAMDRAGHALVSWLGSSSEGAEIRWRRVGKDGKRGPVNVVAATTASRSAGVPRMIRHDDDLLFAWVDDDEPSRLRVGRVALD